MSFLLAGNFFFVFGFTISVEGGLTKYMCRPFKADGHVTQSGLTCVRLHVTTIHRYVEMRWSGTVCYVGKTVPVGFVTSPGRHKQTAGWVGGAVWLRCVE